jgi:hypothetical protein
MLFRHAASKFTEQSPTPDTDTCYPSQEIPHLVRNTKVHYYIQGLPWPQSLARSFQTESSSNNFLDPFKFIASI